MTLLVQRLTLILLLGTILGMAGFAVRQPIQGPQQSQRSEAAKGSESEKEIAKSFWIRTVEDPVSSFTAALVVLTTVLAIVSVVQIRFLARADETARIAARAAADSVEVAQRQANIAEKALVASQRPWITVEVKVAGPMTYGPNGAKFTLDYIMKNVGSSPAMRVYPNARIYSKTRSMPPEDQVLREFLIGMGDPTTDPMGFTIGPNAQQALRIGQSISYDDIRATVESYRLKGRATGLFPIYLVGTVAYRSALASERHETSFYYSILKLNDDPIPRIVGINTRDTSVDASHLILEKNILFSPYMT